MKYVLNKIEFRRELWGTKAFIGMRGNLKWLSKGFNNLNEMAGRIYPNLLK